LGPVELYHSKGISTNKDNQDLASDHDQTDSNEEPVAPYPLEDTEFVIE
jgi:hypothetical protein